MSHGDLDVARALDTPLKVVIIKSLKMNKNYNYKLRYTAKKASKPIFRGEISRGGDITPGPNFPWAIFLGAIFRGGELFSRDIFPDTSDAR